MGLLDLIVDTLNDLAEERGEERAWEALHCDPVELVETPNGIRHRDIQTGRFTNK